MKPGKLVAGVRARFIGIKVQGDVLHLPILSENNFNIYSAHLLQKALDGVQLHRTTGVTPTIHSLLAFWLSLNHCPNLPHLTFSDYL
jgi:hypothetical protein